MTWQLNAACDSGLDPSSLKEIIGTICKTPMGSGDLFFVMHQCNFLSLLVYCDYVWENNLT